jgi:hypothetical protein
MASAWVIVAFVIVAVFVVVKLIDKKQAMAMKLILFLFFLFMVSAGYIYVTRDISLRTLDGVIAAGRIYLGWLGNIFNTGAKVTAYAVQQDWVTHNATTNVTGINP